MLKSLLSTLNKSERITIRSTLCGHTYSTRFSCSHCLDNCPTQGLVWQDNEWKIDDCNRCGKCVSVCPSHVFKLDEDLLIQSCRSNKRIILTCDVLQDNMPEKSKTDVSSIACLCQLYPELVLNLLAEQPELYIYVATDKCRQCLGFDRQELQGQIEALGEFSRQVNWIERVEDLPALTEENGAKSMNRREFMGNMWRRGKRASLEIINEKISDYAKILDDGSCPTSTEQEVQPQKRLRLLMALRAFEQQEVDYEVGILPYQHLQVEQCDFCGICTQLCPGQALVIRDSEGSKSLYYMSHKCTGCGLCQKVCLMGKVSWGRPMHMDELLATQTIFLAEADETSCRLCGDKLFLYPQNQDQTCFDCKQVKHLNPFKRWKYDPA